MTGVLIKRKNLDAKTDSAQREDFVKTGSTGSMPWEHEDRDRDAASPSREMPEILPANHQKPGERHGAGFTLQPSDF